MIGINLLNFDNFVKKIYNTTLILEESETDLLNILKDIDNSYNGDSLNSIFELITEQRTNFEHISDVIENYINVLYEVKKSYEVQSFEIASKINNTIN